MNDNCAPLAGYAVYAWHCDAAGGYSLYSSGITGQNYLRGVQVSDSAGQVTFTTIFPGCYPGRWPHIHFEIYASASAAVSGANAVRISQLAIPESTCRAVYAQAALYPSSLSNLNALTLATDSVFGNDSAVLQLATMTGSVATGYGATLEVGVAAGTGTGTATMPGTGTIVSNPYGAISVSGGTLSGSTIGNLTSGAVIQLGASAGSGSNYLEIDFAALSLGANATLTFRAGAANQGVYVRGADGVASSIAGTLASQAGSASAAPVLYLANAAGVTVTATGRIAAPSGATVETLGATAGTGSGLVNAGTVDGGSSLTLHAAAVNGGGAFKGNSIAIATFGHANNPVNGAHFLSNGLQLSPSTGGSVVLLLAAYGTAPQFINVKVTGNATAAMPTAWSSAIALPANNAPVPAGSTRAAGVAAPGYGGGSLIVQATGSLTLAGSASADFAFPGGIALVAGAALDVGGVLVNQGWTTNGQAFQGVYFEASSVMSSGGTIRVMSNELNWVNFSARPAVAVNTWQLTAQSNGSAAYQASDSLAPHLNTYSTLVEAAANGQCWTCLVNSAVVDMSG